MPSISNYMTVQYIQLKFVNLTECKEKKTIKLKYAMLRCYCEFTGALRQLLAAF